MSSAPRHTLDQLLVLDAILRTGSFAAAARSLHRVPSAVSHAVARLEESLGIAVFDRSGHRAVLTDAGHRILEAGREVLAAARRLDVMADGLQAGWEPTLQVVVDGACRCGRSCGHSEASSRKDTPPVCVSMWSTDRA
jgi:DNA-binding transcriptional LysR family regulator